MARIQTVNYRLTRGEYWERLILIKDARTRRKRVPVYVRAAIEVGEEIWELPTVVTAEGGVKLSLEPEQTLALPDGTHRYDMLARVSRSALLTSSPTVDTYVVRGEITVSSYDSITPRDPALHPDPLEPGEVILDGGAP